MASRKPTKAEQQSTWLWWFVTAPTRVYAMYAEHEEAAKQLVLASSGFLRKPYLARDWNVRLAQPDELRRHLTVYSTREKRSIEESVNVQRLRLESRGLLREETDGPSA